MYGETGPVPRNRPALSGPDAGQPDRGLARLLRPAWLRYRRWCAARRAIRQLREIDAYLLDDIGIERHEIADVVRGGKGPVHAPGGKIVQPALPDAGGKLAA